MNIESQVKVQVIELIVLVVTISGLFMWERSESRDDTRRLEELISTIHRETYQEMKDFHGRLAGIEATRTK
jgi:hypothetical protein